MTDVVGRLLDGADKAQRKGHLALADVCRDASDQIGLLEHENKQLRAALETIVAMKPPIPEDEEGHGPSWQQYIYTRTWAFFAAELQSIASTALLTGGRR